MSKYRLSKESGVPSIRRFAISATVRQSFRIVPEKRSIRSAGHCIFLWKNCSLHILNPHQFDLFKKQHVSPSERAWRYGIYHRNIGVRTKSCRYARMHWYSESLYLLAMVDYISQVNQIPSRTEYASDLRKCKLPGAAVSFQHTRFFQPYQRIRRIPLKAKQEEIPEFKEGSIL